MQFLNSKNVFLWLLSIIIIVTECELITASLIGSVALAAGAGSWLKWDTIKDNTVCRYIECCNDYYIPYNLLKLKISFSEKLFGQPLVNELVYILGAHQEAIENESKQNRKALVISLHGWSGVGKNYAASMVAEALYLKGMQSKFIKMFMGEKDFDCSDISQTKQKLISTINEIVKKCPKSLLIFDEIHDMCPSVLDAIKPMLDHYHAVDGVDYRDSVFIFISNIGGKEIAENLLDLYSQGMKRQDVDFHNFEPIIRRTAYYTGGFEKSSAIAQHLIDHYIPFLPLEQHHVEMCALAAFRTNGVLAPTEEMMANQSVSPVNQVLITLRFYATGTHLLAVGDMHGVDVSTVSRIVKRVTNAIVRLRNQHVKMPRTSGEIQEQQRGFYTIANFPYVIGTIDCTHVKIQSPDALSIITYGPNEDKPIFANNGCKRFTKHIPYVIQKHRSQKTEL